MDWDMPWEKQVRTVYDSLKSSAENLCNICATMVTKLKEDQLHFQQTMERERMQLTEAEQAFQAKIDKAATYVANAKHIVKLNVGGTEFTTTKATLLSEPDTFFDALLRSGTWTPDHGDSYFVDRSPTFFPHILEYLRDGRLYLVPEKLSNEDNQRFLAEIEFYQIQSLQSTYSSPHVYSKPIRGRLSTVVGTGQGAYSGDGGQATAAAVQYPHGVCFHEGRLFIADSGNHRIRSVHLLSGTIVTVAGSGQKGCDGDGGLATAAKLNCPTRVTADQNKLYIADYSSHIIRAVDLHTGNIETVAGNRQRGDAGDGGAATKAQLNRPRGIAVFDSKMYIADTGNHRIRRVDLETGIIDTCVGTGQAGYSGDEGKATQAQLTSPCDVTIHDNKLFISDTGNHRIRVVDVIKGVIRTLAVVTQQDNNSFSSAPSTKADSPTSPATNGSFGTNPLGVASSPTSTTTNKAVMLSGPCGLAVHGNKLFIAVNLANCVRVVDLTNDQISTLCGSSSSSNKSSGTEVGSHLANPVGVAVSSHQLFVSEAGHHRVRVVG